MGRIFTSGAPPVTPKVLMRMPLGWCAAAVGSTSRCSAGRRSATTSRPTTAPSTWASASPGLFPLALDRLYPWQAFWTWRERDCEEGSEAEPRPPSSRATRRPATSTSLAALPAGALVLAPDGICHRLPEGPARGEARVLVLTSGSGCAHTAAAGDARPHSARACSGCPAASAARAHRVHCCAARPVPLQCSLAVPRLRRQRPRYAPRSHSSRSGFRRLRAGQLFSSPSNLLTRGSPKVRAVLASSRKRLPCAAGGASF